MPVFAFRCDYGNVSIKGLRDKIRTKNPDGEKRFEAKYEENAHDARGVTPIGREPVLVYFGEWANFGDFKNYLESLNFVSKQENVVANKILKIMLFQLIYTYAIILEKYPSFRHNDLSLMNVLVQEIDTEELATRSPPITQPYSYTFNDNNFIIPLQNASIRLWDFDFANVDELKNKKALDKYYEDSSGIGGNACPQYDMHYFFSGLRVWQGLAPETRRFIDTWVPRGTKPSGSYLTDSGRLSMNTQKRHMHRIKTIFINKDGKDETIKYSQLTPQYSLENDFFWNEFRKTPEEVGAIKEFSGSFSN